MAYIRCTKGHLENQPCAADGGMQCPWCQLDDCMQYIDAMIADRDYFADELQKKEAENETNAKDAEELEAALKLSQEATQTYCDEDKKLRQERDEAFGKGIHYAAGFLAGNGHYDQSNALLALLKKNG